MIGKHLSGKPCSRGILNYILIGFFLKQKGMLQGMQQQRKKENT